MGTYYALPPDARDDAPSIVLAMHLFGVDRHIREAADRFAEAGFATVVPDLYESFDAPGGDGRNDYQTFVPFARRLTFESVDPQIRGAAAWLRDRYPRTRTAIAGFCMGGVIALRRTYGYSDVFSAAAIWYGAIGETPAAAVDIPVVASYGAADAVIPVDSVRAFQSALRVPNDVAVYPDAGHAFCDSTRESYEPHACEASWRRTIDFLQKYVI